MDLSSLDGVLQNKKNFVLKYNFHKEIKNNKAHFEINIYF